MNSVQPSWLFVPNGNVRNSKLAVITRTTFTCKVEFNLPSIGAPTLTTITGILVGDVNNSWLIPA